jgi:hypothetical protein
MRPDEVQLDGVPLASMVAGDMISVLVQADRIAAPGRHWLEMVDPVADLWKEHAPFYVIASWRSPVSMAKPLRGWTATMDAGRLAFSTVPA